MSTSSTNTKETLQSVGMTIVPRRSKERGYINYGWLKTFHTFSFGPYQHSGHESFGSLRAINENRVSAHTGFGVHSHSDFEVLSYVISGELQYRSNDSLRTTGFLKRGDVELISAGTDVYHSKQAQNQDVHLLEIWTSQALSTLAPSQFIRHFSDEDKMQGWVRIAAPVSTLDVDSDQDASGSAPIRSGMTIYSTILASGASRSFQLSTTKGYIHIIQTFGYNVGVAQGAEIKLNGGDDGTIEVKLREGDGAYIMFAAGKEVKVQNIRAGVAEVLLFEIK